LSVTNIPSLVIVGRDAAAAERVEDGFFPPQNPARKETGGGVDKEMKSSCRGGGNHATAVVNLGSEVAKGQGCHNWIAHSYMRTIPNAFIVNMSLSDLLMAVLNTIFNYVYMRDRNWIFGNTYCQIKNFSDIVTVATSVLNLTAMSIDRYKAIVWPLKVRTSKSVVAATILLIWIGSVIFALPALLLSKTIRVGGGKFACTIYWPDLTSELSPSYQDHIYNILILLVTYILPIMLIGVCSFHMGIVLWCRQPVGVITPQLQRAKQKKQKIVKMLVVLIVIFAVCWLPYHAYFIYSYHYPDVRKMQHIQHIYLSFYWFAMTHSMVNPIVYYLMNPTFRRYYRHILTLKFLKPDKHDAPAGLVLASAFGLQVAAQIAYGNSGVDADHTESGRQRSRSLRIRREESMGARERRGLAPSSPPRPSSSSFSKFNGSSNVPPDCNGDIQLVPKSPRDKAMSPDESPTTTSRFRFRLSLPRSSNRRNRTLGHRRRDHVASSAATTGTGAVTVSSDPDAIISSSSYAAPPPRTTKPKGFHATEFLRRIFRWTQRFRGKEVDSQHPGSHDDDDHPSSGSETGDGSIEAMRRRRRRRRRGRSQPLRLRHTGVYRSSSSPLPLKTNCQVVINGDLKRMAGAAAVGGEVSYQCTALALERHPSPSHAPLLNDQRSALLPFQPADGDSDRASSPAADKCTDDQNKHKSKSTIFQLQAPPPPPPLCKLTKTQQTQQKNDLKNTTQQKQPPPTTKSTSSCTSFTDINNGNVQVHRAAVSGSPSANINNATITGRHHGQQTSSAHNKRHLTTAV